jgi:hypothetical protein
MSPWISKGDHLLQSCLLQLSGFPENAGRKHFTQARPARKDIPQYLKSFKKSSWTNMPDH